MRAGTKDVAKIFQILYDVEAVSGPGGVTYLGAAPEVQSKRANQILYSTIMENSLSISNSTSSTSNLSNVDNLSDSTLVNTMIKYGANATLEDYSGRFNSDAISVGSNDSDV